MINLVINNEINKTMINLSTEDIAFVLDVGHQSAMKYRKKGVEFLEQQLRLDDFISGYVREDYAKDIKLRIGFIRRKLAEHGLTVKQAARLIGTGQGYLSLCLNQKTPFRTDIYESLINLLIKIEENGSNS